MERQLDNEGVDKFSILMRERMAQGRANGFCGWHRDDCDASELAETLVRTLFSGDKNAFVDAANLCMMLQLKGADPAMVSQAASEQVAEEPCGYAVTDPTGQRLIVAEKEAKMWMAAGFSCVAVYERPQHTLSTNVDAIQSMAELLITLETVGKQVVELRKTFVGSN